MGGSRGSSTTKAKGFANHSFCGQSGATRIMERLWESITLNTICLRVHPMPALYAGVGGGKGPPLTVKWMGVHWPVPSGVLWGVKECFIPLDVAQRHSGGLRKIPLLEWSCIIEYYSPDQRGNCLILKWAFLWLAAKCMTATQAFTWDTHYFE